MSLLAREGGCVTLAAPEDMNKLEQRVGGFLQLISDGKPVFSFA